MDAGTAVDLCRATLMSAVIIAAPVLLVGMAAGLLVGLMQALIQVQDQTVAFVPKIMAMAAVLVVCLPWLLTRMVEFTRVVLRMRVRPDGVANELVDGASGTWRVGADTLEHVVDGDACCWRRCA